MTSRYRTTTATSLRIAKQVVSLLAVAFWTVDSILAQSAPIDVPVHQLGTKYRLLGKLGVPLGDVVKVEGIVVEGPFKGYEGGPNVRVQRINGRATQEHIQIDVPPNYDAMAKNDDSVLPKLEIGQTYEFDSYETGRYEGIPDFAYEPPKVTVQTTGNHFGFRTKWRVHRAKQIAKISIAPSDFIDRAALLEGTAVNRNGHASIEHDVWTLTVATKPWHQEFEGKLVEAFGVVRKTTDPHAFVMEQGPRRLVKLEDQIGRQVELRGTALSMNDEWWFNYRGTNIYVENMENLPNWRSKDLHYCPVTIKGVLKSEMLPAIRGENNDLKQHYIVRNASWEYAGPLLFPEVMP